MLGHLRCGGTGASVFRSSGIERPSRLVYVHADAGKVLTSTFTADHVFRHSGIFLLGRVLRCTQQLSERVLWFKERSDPVAMEGSPLM